MNRSSAHQKQDSFHFSIFSLNIKFSKGSLAVCVFLCGECACVQERVAGGECVSRASAWK